MICAVADTVGITVVESVSSTGCLASFLTAYSTVVGIMLVDTVTSINLDLVDARACGLLPSVDPRSLAGADWDVKSHLRLLRVVFIAIFTSSFRLFDGVSSNIGVGSARSWGLVP